MRHGSLFSGIGGFDLAAQWIGWENVFQVEIDRYCQRVLEKNFPNVRRYGNIKGFDGTKYRGTIDAISGGFPCQKFSLSGKGTADLTEWKEMLRVVGEVGPWCVVVENVYGLYVRKGGLVFETVCADLESIGFAVQPFIIPACATGAPHQRDRIWIVAYSDREYSAISEQQWPERQNCPDIRRESEIRHAAYSNGIGLRGALSCQAGWGVMVDFNEHAQRIYLVDPYYKWMHKLRG